MDSLLLVQAAFEKKKCREHTVEELRVLYSDVRDFKRLVEDAKRMDKRTADTTYTAFAHSRFQELRRNFSFLDERLKLLDNDDIRRSRSWILENFSNALTVKRKNSLTGKMGAVISSLSCILDEIQSIGIDLQVQEI
ncbi:hypothetical protein [Stenotrophomonas sp. PS02301]|uniref:hypothetical protein n=1 Tax=Stenotrophomonas sp. PS02301 TaxID=2991427 RepID=UPI00249AD612|nr:hypothetical protein [Stenotrophomonas sp. PS02301]